MKRGMPAKITGLLLAALLVPACGRRSQDQELRIGAVLALTDRGATYGERAKKGMVLAVDELNATLFFQAHPLKLLIEDSQSSAPRALAAFEKLIAFDDVQVAVGFVMSDEVLTCAPVANSKKVVLFTTAAGSDRIKDAGDYVFRNRESGAAQSEAIAHACIKRFHFKEAAILHSTSANGVSYRDGFKSAVEKQGGSIIVSVAYNEGKTDYRAEIEQLRAKLPKAVYLAGLDHEMGLILKQCKEVGFAPQFFASAGAISPKLLEIAGAGAEGLVCGSAPFNLESQDAKVQAFVKGFKARFNDDPDWIAANSYDAIYLLTDLYKNGAITGDQLKAGLDATKDYPGVGGLTTFDKFGEVSKPILLVVVKARKFVPLTQ